MDNGYSVVFHPTAEKEYLESVDWYEDRLVGLGNEFITEIGNTIKRIKNNPLSFPEKEFQFREAMVKKFSFIIVFEIKKQQINIISVFHTSRNPDEKYRK